MGELTSNPDKGDKILIRCDSDLIQGSDESIKLYENLMECLTKSYQDLDRYVL